MVFFSGLALWILAVLVTGLTRNPNLIPTVVLVGSFLIPATAVIYYLDHLPSPTVSAQRVFIAFLYGGVLGVLAASLLEAWLLQDGPLVYVGVGLIEEFAKVLALLLIWFANRTINRYFLQTVFFDRRMIAIGITAMFGRVQICSANCMAM